MNFTLVISCQKFITRLLYIILVIFIKQTWWNIKISNCIYSKEGVWFFPPVTYLWCIVNHTTQRTYTILLIQYYTLGQNVLSAKDSPIWKWNNCPIENSLTLHAYPPSPGVSKYTHVKGTYNIGNYLITKWSNYYQKAYLMWSRHQSSWTVIWSELVRLQWKHKPNDGAFALLPKKKNFLLFEFSVK